MARKQVNFVSAIAFAAAAVVITLLSSRPCSALSGAIVPRIRPFEDFPNADAFLRRNNAGLMSTPDAFNVTVSSDVVSRLVAGQRSVVNVTVASAENLTEPPNLNKTPGYFLLRANATNLKVLKLVSGSRHSWTTATGSIETVSLELEGVDIGYSFVRFAVDDANSNSTLRPERDDILVSVVRPSGVMNVVSDVFLTAAPIVSQVAMGSQVDMDVIRSELRRPKALISGLLCQHIIMPSLAYGLLMAMQWRGGIALGFFAFGCAPGGGLSNLFTVLLDGDITLSTALTLQSTLLALGFVPLWMYTLGTTLPAEDGLSPIRIPFVSMAISLAITVGPVFVGLLIKFKIPRLAKFIGATMKPVFIVAVLATYALILYVNSYVFDWFDAPLVFTAASLPTGGFFIAMFVAYVIRLKWSVIKTISIETGVQSAMVASVFVNQSLQKPAADLALIPVAAAMLVGPMPLVVLSIGYTIYRKVVSRSHQRKLTDADPWQDLDSLGTSSQKEKQVEANGESLAETFPGTMVANQGGANSQDTSLTTEIEPCAEVSGGKA